MTPITKTEQLAGAIQPTITTELFNKAIFGNAIIVPVQGEFWIYSDNLKTRVLGRFDERIIAEACLVTLSGLTEP